MPEQELTLAELPQMHLPPAQAAQMRRWLDTNQVLDLIHTEREAQHAQWGDQAIPIGGDPERYARMTSQYRERCQRKTAEGTVTMVDVLLEEVFEACEVPDSDPLRQIDELVQVAAVAVKAIELIRRGLPTTPPAGQADSA